MEFSLESAAVTHGFYHTAPSSGRHPDPRSECHPFSSSVSSPGWTPVPADPHVPRPRSPYRLYTKAFLGLRASASGAGNVVSRRKREFTPDEQKDSSYWVKRKRNNEAARRSRQRRRMDELLLEKRAVELLRENEKLKATLSAVHFPFVEAGNGPPVAPAGFSPRGFATRRVHPPPAVRCDPQPSSRFPLVAPSWMPTCGPSHAVFPDTPGTYMDPTLSVLDSFRVLPVSAAHRVLSGEAGPVVARTSPSVPPAASAPLQDAQYPRKPVTCGGVGDGTFRVRSCYPGASRVQQGGFEAAETSRCQSQADAQTKNEDAPSGHRVAHNPGRRHPQSASEFSPPDCPHEQNVVHRHPSGPKVNSLHKTGGSEADAVVVETAAPCLPYKLRFKANGCKRYQDFCLEASTGGKNSTGGGVVTNRGITAPMGDGREAAHQVRQ